MGMKTGVLMALLLSSTLTLTFNIQPAKTSGDLVGYWKFDEGSGTTAYDSSGNGNDGILINGPVWTAGKVDGALRFDGIDDIVVVPDSASLDITQEIVIAMWVRPFSIPSVAVRLIEKTDYWGPYQVEFAEGLKPRFHILGAGHTANSAISLDEWNFLAFTYNGTNKRIYINGLLDLDLLVTGHLTTDDNPVTIGGSLAYSFTFFDGIIDDVRIYNRALSEEEIRAIMDMDVHDVAITNVILSKTIVDQGYNTDINVIAANQGNYQETFDVTLYAEPVINETGLVGYWNFDSCDAGKTCSPNVKDLSGKGDNGTWVGTASTTANSPGTMPYTDLSDGLYQASRRRSIVPGGSPFATGSSVRPKAAVRPCNCPIAWLPATASTPSTITCAGASSRASSFAAVPRGMTSARFACPVCSRSSISSRLAALATSRNVPSPITSSTYRRDRSVRS